MRLSLTVKLITGVVCILVISLAVLERKASSIYYEDKSASLLERSSQISYGIAIAASEKVKRLDRHLRLILTHAALNSPLEMRPSGDEMLMVGSLLKTQTQQWEVQWTIKPDSDKALDALSQSFLDQIQKQSSLDQVRADEHHFSKLVTMDGQPLFVMLIRMTKPSEPTQRIGFAVLSGTTFFDIIGPFKGSTTMAFLVDQNGNVFGHPNLNLTGSSLSGHPVVDQISKKFSASQVAQYQMGEDLIIGSYDPVVSTNLSAVTSISLTNSTEALAELRWSFVLLGLGLIILAALFSNYISHLLKSPLKKLRMAIDDMGAGRRTYVDPNGDEELTALALSLVDLDKKIRLKEVEVQSQTSERIYKEKMSAFSQMSNGLVNELRNPLIGILGHTQLAREKLRDPEGLRRHLDFIERDTRKTKELIEDISQFTGVDKLDLSQVNLYEALTSSIEQASRKLLPLNISIIKNLESASSAYANPVLLRKALFNIIASCGNLVKSDGPKELVIRLESEADSAKITIEFESQILNDIDVERIFDPFLILDGRLNLGLDLALARGILDAHDSKVKLSRLSEEKFQFSISVPKVQENKAESPFSERPGLELRGLTFALPEFSMNEKIESEPVEKKIEVEFKAEAPAVRKRIMSRIPLEAIKVKVRKPTLRT